MKGKTFCFSLMLFHVLAMPFCLVSRVSLVICWCLFGILSYRYSLGLLKARFCVLAGFGFLENPFGFWQANLRTPVFVMANRSSTMAFQRHQKLRFVAPSGGDRWSFGRAGCPLSVLGFPRMSTNLKAPKQGSL